MARGLGINKRGFANSSVTTSQVSPIAATELSAPVLLYLPFDSDLNDDAQYTLSGTASGSAAINTGTKQFGAASLYTPSDGDYVTYDDSSNSISFSGDYTIEAWVYFTDVTSNNNYIWSKRTNTGTHSNNAWAVKWMGGSDNAWEIFQAQGSSQHVTFHADTITTGVWYHIAVVRYGTNLFLFRDGSLIEGTNTTGAGGTLNNPTSTNIVLGDIMGGTSALGFSGYIDDFRISDGVARYTKSFIPPSQAVGAKLTGANETNTTTNFTALYLPFTADLNDDSSHSHTLTAVGSVAISSAQSKYGSNSAAFDGNGDGLTIPSSAAFDFGSGDFTIEAWVYLNNTSQVHHIASWRSDSGAGSTNWHLDVPGGSNFTFHASNGSSYIVDSGTMSMPATTGWQHVAVTRSRYSFMMFHNGLLMATTRTSGTIASTTRNFNIGLDPASDSNCLNGYINDLRILAGHAKYTADFAVPTSTVGTSVSESVNDLAVLYLPFDDSSMEDQARNHAITKNGSTSSRINTSVKKFGTSSARFEDAERCIEIPDGKFDFGSNDFTIEGWFYDDGSGGSRNVALDYRQSGGGAAGAGNETFGFFFYLDEGGNGKFFIGLQDESGNSAADLGHWPMLNSSSLAISTNTWTHYAITREGTTFRAFKDGSLIATQTGVSAPNASSSGGAILRIGSGHDSSGSVGMSGYIDDLRIINGKAIYTAAFTPPTSAVGLAVESGGVTTSTVDNKFLSSVWSLKDQNKKISKGEWIRNDAADTGANGKGRVIKGAGLEDTNHRWYVAPSPVQIAWGSTYQGTDVLLSNSDLTAAIYQEGTSSWGQNSVVSVGTHSSGKVYFEAVVSGNPTSGYMRIGVVQNKGSAFNSTIQGGSMGSWSSDVPAYANKSEGLITT
jgi:hypothetical protein